MNIVKGMILGLPLPVIALVIITSHSPFSEVSTHRTCDGGSTEVNTGFPDMPLHWELPSVFDANIYRQSNRFRNMNVEQLTEHYMQEGKLERRPSNALWHVDDFIKIVEDNSRLTLEIGPSCRPTISGNRVKYADVADETALFARAQANGYPIQRCPHINYVVPEGNLSQIPEAFDAVVSSHNIQHQVDLVRHLQHVEDILVDGGYMFLVIPDKRFMFDVPIAASTIADVLDAYYNPRRNHNLKSVVEHLALTTHNDARRHWEAFQAEKVQPTVDIERVKNAVEWWKRTDQHIDVHKWQFTPKSFAEIIGVLEGLHYIRFVAVRVYPARFGQQEFWAILQKRNNHGRQ